MPKQKTHKGAIKRFKITKKGKVIHLSQFGRHGQRKKTPQSKRRHKEPKVLTGEIARKVRRIVGAV